MQLDNKITSELGSIPLSHFDATAKLALWHRLLYHLEMHTGCDVIIIDLNPSLSKLNMLAILA